MNVHNHMLSIVNSADWWWLSVSVVWIVGIGELANGRDAQRGIYDFAFCPVTLFMFVFARLVRSGRQYHQAVCFVPARWLIRMQWDAGSFVCVWEKSRCCRFSSFCLSRRWSWRQAGSPWNCSDCCSRAFPIRLAVFRVFIGILFIGCFVLIWLIILVWQDFKVVCDDCPKCHCEDEIPVGGTFLEFFKVVSDDEA